MELEPIRHTIAVFGQSAFRVLRRQYRRAVAELNNFCHTSPPKRYNERVRLLDELILAQEARRCLADEATFARDVLGDLWDGEESAWPKIQELIEWVEQCDQALAGLDPFRSEVISANVPWDTVAAEIEDAAAELLAALGRIVSLTGAEPTPILGTWSWDDAPITDIADVIDGWQRSLDAYNHWIGAREALDTVREIGLGLIANGLNDGSLEPSIRPVKNRSVIGRSALASGSVR